ncbi:MAG TPA: peptidase C14 caspase catalytic subunit p20, partial [Cytophagales bacterium]|nr:peptidase C14 caspase catalytic subunit p20 [Cytophagales bacterium]
GLYTSKLMKYLDVPGLKIEEVFKQVRIEVGKESNNSQIPWESNSLMGDFYFTLN